MLEENSTQILEIDGIPLSKEEVGELHMRGRSVMRGYYRAPELTAKVIDNEGWFNTGARFDGDCLYIVGRAKEMIIRSGFNVYPAEVEAVLSSHKDSCSPPWLAGPQMAMAGSQATPQDVMSFMRSQLTSYKRQSKIIILDGLPATSTGKILKHKLAEALCGEAPPAQAAPLRRQQI